MVLFHFVSTPIGNLGDLSFRALEILKAADVVLCEDTRHSRKLMTHYGLSKKLVAFHDFSGDQQLQKIGQLMMDGKHCVYISDAGTPMISDPGYEIARYLEQNGFPFDIIPGANAVLPALQLSGLPCDRFTFLGFLPRKEKEITDILNRYAGIPTTLVFYQSPRRIHRTLQVLHDLWPDREVAVVKELTKIHQHTARGLPGQLLDRYTDLEKGEFVLVIAPPSGDSTETDWPAIRKEFTALLACGVSRKSATRYLARSRSLSSKELYTRSMDWE